MGSDPYTTTVDHEHRGRASPFRLDSLRNAITAKRSRMKRRSGVSPLPMADGAPTSADGAVTATISGERLEADADGERTAARDRVNEEGNNRSAQFGDQSRHRLRKIGRIRVGETRQVAETMKPRGLKGKSIRRGDAQSGLQFLVCVPA